MLRLFQDFSPEIFGDKKTGRSFRQLPVDGH